MEELLAVVDDVEEGAFVFVFDRLLHLLHLGAELVVDEQLLHGIRARIFTRICDVDTAENGKRFLESSA